MQNHSHTPGLSRFWDQNQANSALYSAFWSVEQTDPKNVIIENIHWALFEDAEVAEVKRPQNPKFGLGDLENDLLTSMTSEWAQWFFSKIIFLKSGEQAEKNEL